LLLLIGGTADVQKIWFLLPYICDKKTNIWKFTTLILLEDGQNVITTSSFAKSKLMCMWVVKPFEYGTLLLICSAADINQLD